jgi:subtilisin family serine protease
MKHVMRAVRRICALALMTASFRVFLSIAAVVSFVPVLFATGDARVHHAAKPIPNQYIVILANTRAQDVTAVANSLARAHHGRVIVTLTHGFHGFGIEMNGAEADALARDPNVARIEENGEGDISYSVENFTDDTFWHLDRLDNTTPINGTKSYGYSTTGANVNLYVIGMGVQARHVEFDNDGNPATAGSRVTLGVDYFRGMPDGYGGSLDDTCCYGTDLSGAPFVHPTTPDNPCGGYVNHFDAGHDTAVASIAGGTQNGVAKGVRIIPVRITGCGPVGQLAGRSSLGMCWALDWILQDMHSPANAGRRGVVVCASYWTTPNSEVCNGVNCVSAIENNINNVIGGWINGVPTVPGIPVVVSANNQNDGNCSTSPARMGNPSYPTYFHTITVGGTDITDHRWCNGNCSTATLGSNYGACVNIYAPAANVHGAHIAGFTSYRSDASNFHCGNPNDWYCNGSPSLTQSGTSFAAPVVAGVAARLLEGHPSWAATDVWPAIQQRAIRLSYSLDPSSNYNNLLVYLSPYE